MRGMKTILAIATAAVALTGAPAAQAADSDALTCRVAFVGTQYIASVCFEVTTGLSGTTVAPSLYVAACAYDASVCDNGSPIQIGTTGYTGGGGGAFPVPEVDLKNGGVRWDGGHLGTVWVGGAAVPVSVQGFCVGTPTFCA